MGQDNSGKCVSRIKTTSGKIYKKCLSEDTEIAERGKNKSKKVFVGEDMMQCDAGGLALLDSPLDSLEPVIFC